MVAVRVLCSALIYGFMGRVVWDRKHSWLRRHCSGIMLEGRRTEDSKDQIRRRCDGGQLAPDRASAILICFRIAGLLQVL